MCRMKRVKTYFIPGSQFHTLWPSVTWVYVVTNTHCTTNCNTYFSHKIQTWPLGYLISIGTNWILLWHDIAVFLSHLFYRWVNLVTVEHWPATQRSWIQVPDAPISLGFFCFKYVRKTFVHHNRTNTPLVSRINTCTISIEQFLWNITQC